MSCWAALEMALSGGNSYSLSRIRLRRLDKQISPLSSVQGLLVDGLDVFRLEGRSTDNEGVKNDTNRPGVDFEAVSVGSIEQDLRCNIIWRSADSLLPLARIFN